MPKVFTYYFGLDENPPPEQARMIKAWMLSWKKHGWTPRLLCKRTCPKVPAVLRWNVKLDGVFVPFDLINLGLRGRPARWEDQIDKTLFVFDDPTRAMNAVIHAPRR